MARSGLLCQADLVQPNSIPAFTRPDSVELFRIRFLGRLPQSELSRLLGQSDIHLYPTTPFGLSWSLQHAMACGAPILASDTAPVREVIRNGETGLLAGFDDVDRWVHLANAAPNDSVPPMLRICFRLAKVASDANRNDSGPFGMVPKQPGVIPDERE